MRNEGLFCSGEIDFLRLLHQNSCRLDGIRGRFRWGEPKSICCNFADVQETSI